MTHQNASLSPETAAQVETDAPTLQPSSVEELQDWLAHQVAIQIGEDPEDIDIHTPFNQFGLDSVQAMGIAVLGKQQLGVEVSPLVMWNCPTIDALSHYLAEEIARSETETFSI
ncbi:MAG: acyl carrier protein [Nodosilinea sp.]